MNPYELLIILVNFKHKIIGFFQKIVIIRILQ